MAVIPKEAEQRYYEIEKIIEEFAIKYLDEEYSNFSSKLLESLCRKNWKKVLRGKSNVWACAIVYVIGKINFLFDSNEKPYMKVKDLFSIFNVSSSSITKRYNEICEILNITLLDIKWTLPSNIEKNPLTWLINLDGFITDIRYSSKNIQEKALEKKLFDYIPNCDDLKDEKFFHEELSGESLEEILDLNTLIEILQDEDELDLIDSENITKINNLSDMEEILFSLNDENYFSRQKCKIIQFPVKSN
ncbi:DUF6398 domain-containing protein [Clostridium senegalense]|uniref:DUF6398 domain-containing protein n=1 Tax=Clostridium senegalense TaxID=1465809 RepID=UPI001C110227|nr:DUF6398 domain-containing protein [Clostridium senegalense]MBU5227907.1 hypothetical protein [Clostridium senegalense]